MGRRHGRLSQRTVSPGRNRYEIIRGANLRRHEVDFGEEPISVSIHASDEVVEIFIEADGEDRPEERRRFALVNVPRHLFSAAIADLARQKGLQTR